MSAIYLRGGIPVIVTGVAPGNVSPMAEFRFKGGISNHIAISNLDEVTDMLVCFTPEDAAAGIGFPIPAKPGSCGNPLELPAEVGPFFVRSAGPGPVNFRAIGCLRRG